MDLKSLFPKEPLTPILTTMMAKEVSYSVLARYFPKKYSKKDIEAEIKDRVLMTRYLKSLSLTSIKFETALTDFIDLIKSMLPKFDTGNIQDLSGLVSTRLDVLSQMIEDFIKDFKPEASGDAHNTEEHAPSGSPQQSKWLGGAITGGSILGAAGAMGPSQPSGSNAAASLGGEYSGPGASGDASALLDHIAKSEGTNYNTQFGYQHTTGGAPLTSLTIGQIMDVQSQQSGSSAIGRYQFMKGTLPEAMAGAGLTTSDLFNEANQDKMARYLLNKRGYGDWKTGRINDQQFAGELSREWASLPDPSKGQKIGHYPNQNARYDINALYGVLKGAQTAAANITNGDPKKLFAGGVTNGPTHAIIGDNSSGREFVIPEEKMQQVTDMIRPSFGAKQRTLTRIQPIIIFQ